jgi:hypothetical protein
MFYIYAYTYTEKKILKNWIFFTNSFSHFLVIENPRSKITLSLKKINVSFWWKEKGLTTHLKLLSYMLYIHGSQRTCFAVDLQQQ